MAIRRNVTRVRGGFPQGDLFAPFDPGPPEPSPGSSGEGIGRTSFVDPSPASLTIGSKDLKTFLQETGQGGVLRVREIVREIDYSDYLKRYQPQGRTPYHPALYLGLILHGVMHGVSSLRGLESLAKSDVRCWWLTGGCVPDHSSIGRFVQIFGDLLPGHTFEALTRAVLKRTGGSATDLSGDGTTVVAAGSRYAQIKEEAARLAASKLREQAGRASGAIKQTLEQKAKRFELAAETAKERTAARQKDRGVNTKVEPVTVSPTEPEAVRQKLKDGSTAPSYKPSVLANPQRVITAQCVVGSAENAAVDPLCEQAKRVAERDSLDCARFDAGYFTVSTLQTLLRHDVEDILISERAVAAHKRGKVEKKFAKANFDFDQAADAYVCPAGHKLIRKRPTKKQKKRGARYSGAPCATCPFKDECAPNGERVLYRTATDHVLEAARHVMGNPGARKNYAMRAAYVEPVFAELRQVQGLTRFLRRGLQNVRVEFSLHAMAHNLRRMLAIEAKPALAAALQGSDPRALLCFGLGSRLWIEFSAFAAARCPDAPSIRRAA